MGDTMQSALDQFLSFDCATAPTNSATSQHSLGHTSAGNGAPGMPPHGVAPGRPSSHGLSAGTAMPPHGVAPGRPSSHGLSAGMGLLECLHMLPLMVSLLGDLALVALDLGTGLLEYLHMLSLLGVMEDTHVTRLSWLSPCWITQCCFEAPTPSHCTLTSHQSGLAGCTV